MLGNNTYSYNTGQNVQGFTTVEMILNYARLGDVKSIRVRDFTLCPLSII